ncbi:MAG TPA: sialate O-acetylesterase [Chthoniobacteraceae bacterium]|nr:sialate O-acetylesterase [Chthoniobacteraceae bacterium]
MKNKLLISLLALLMPLVSHAAIINVYFAGGQSNATEEWRDGIIEQLHEKDPSAVVVWATHGGTALHEWYTGYEYEETIGRQSLYLKDFYNPDLSETGLLETAFHDLTEQGDTPVLSGLFWFQGETDQYIEESHVDDRYYHDFLAFRDAIKEDFKAPNLPVSLAVVYEGPRGGPVRPGLQSIRDQQFALGLLPDIFAYDTIDLERYTDYNIYLTNEVARQTGREMVMGLPVAIPEVSSLGLLLSGCFVVIYWRFR